MCTVDTQPLVVCVCVVCTCVLHVCVHVHARMREWYTADAVQGDQCSPWWQPLALQYIWARYRNH